MSRGTQIVIGTLLAGLAGTACGLADQKKDDKSVNVQVWAIRATTKNKEISPELKEIAEKLKKDTKYTGFKLEKKASGSAAIGKTFTATLIGGYTAKVTPKSVDSKKVELQITITKEKEKTPKLDTTVKLAAGDWQLSGGMDLDGGDALIVAVSGK